ncbi:type II secretion system protein [Limnoraphis robusta Tam1]|uniref:Type II secretion system protein n=1 Tax=Limnoraphis robusta CCNP1315 TaxID=3110306 RepID=A0ABU5U6B7_9CYAN|nr:type II secretion system protein [Limnoraphis robusta]MEA5500121.1 type II secretion system protein [Limnoraphis robusta BA-68 BA1]MEA5522729.1 type II secretion system protein [Limnoraphis robusta CCNP1315]MEA5540238.1 type II secretion system protein [Limnoraphis robusta Tam1]MEA5543813.1 type II secretion system protein [Limnoraphis robusta CCNP1324]
MKPNTRLKCDRQISRKPFTSLASSSKVRYTTGYTITEILLVVGLISIFAGIAVPAWMGFISRQQLRTGANRVYWAMRSAQSEAKRQKTSVQASFREKDNRVQWAVHLASVPPNDLSDSAWESLPSGVLIDDKVKNDKGRLETTLLKVDPVDNSVRNAGTVYRALFNYKGCPIYESTDECTHGNPRAKGRLGLIHKNLEKQKRCVIISTLIGVVRTGEEHTKPQDNLYCY